VKEVFLLQSEDKTEEIELERMENGGVWIRCIKMGGKLVLKDEKVKKGK
jgi:hypothetical protein